MKHGKTVNEDESIKGTNESIRTTLKGKKNVTINHMDDQTTYYTLEPVKYCKSPK